MTFKILFAAGAVLLTSSLPTVAPAEDLPLQSGDTVVMIGSTLIERARLYGHLEAALQMAAGLEIEGLTFRNLGWSADSVFADSRSYFGTPQEGRARLAANIEELKPTVVFLAYGTGEAMSVEQGWTNEKDAAEASAAGLETSLELFIDGYQKKIDAIRNASAGSIRELILLSPPPLENLGELLPDQTQNNRNLASFRDAIAELARKNQARFVDLFASLGGDDFDGSIADPALTDNGVHYTEEGYARLAQALIRELGYDETHFVSSDQEAEKVLRNAIIEKNRLFFHRWRPANETYLFLFRKHEQGQNAKEIPMFDPLIEAQEARIAKARQLVFSGKTKN
ncbi:MAG: GDSL-type esterase/lipase family protein [Verrucomicrobiales bacterium]|nr:GDSL-type esterase/lipase family protein [Verrucomicrobiales bacterium]